MIENSNSLNEPPSFPSIGEMLTHFLDQEKRSPAALSRKLNMNISSVMKMKQKTSFQLKLLWDISMAQQHNFIADVAVQLPPAFSGAFKDILSAKDEEIAILQTAIETIKKERDLYKELLVQ